MGEPSVSILTWWLGAWHSRRGLCFFYSTSGNTVMTESKKKSFYSILKLLATHSKNNLTLVSMASQPAAEQEMGLHNYKERKYTFRRMEGKYFCVQLAFDCCRLHWRNFQSVMLPVTFSGMVFMFPLKGVSIWESKHGKHLQWFRDNVNTAPHPPPYPYVMRLF